MQYELAPADLALVLALHRAGTLAAAGERLNVNASTVFRMLQRLERGLGQALFERGRRGYKAMELARTLAAQAEQVEAALEAARTAAQAQPGQAAGTVRITTTDTLLHGLLAPALAALHRAQPRLQFELHTGNELASLTRRDADIAVRATKRPPQHLVGTHVGPIRVALFAPAKGKLRHYDEGEVARASWIAPDDALPEHPSVVWRKRHFAKVQPTYRVNSIHSVMELITLGLGIGILPLFLAQGRPALLQLTEPLDDCQTELWLLTHPESRHLRRVAAVYRHLAESMTL